jgi:chromosome segregation ATPase
MNNRTGIVILAVVAVGLAVALFVVRKNDNDEKLRDTDTILNFSNRLVSTQNDLAEQRQVNVMLTNDLSAQNAQILSLTNQLLETSNSLIQTVDQLKSAQDDIVKRDAKINELETQNQELDKKAEDMSTTITNLSTQITETQRKLDSTEGDKEFLEKELKRLMVEKAEMERRFNDLEIMRAQVKKLKDELSFQRRLDWIRRGIFGEQKAAEVMVQQTGQNRPAVTNASAPRYDLNVEVESDGTVRIIPSATNSPATTNQ